MVPAAQRSFLIVARDITDRHCFQCALHAAKEQAEKANLAKTRFLAAASHDLRQPAQSLTLLTTLLSSKLAGHPAAPIIEHLQTSVDALRLLLDGILDVSRLDAGLVVAAPRNFAIAALLGHQVRVRSRVGRGSCFSISIPLAENGGGAPCRTRGPPPGTSRKARSAGSAQAN